jgi:hypothetical protein
MLSEDQIRKLVYNGQFTPLWFKVIKSTDKTCFVACLMKSPRGHYYVRLTEFYRKDGEWRRSDVNLNTAQEIRLMISVLVDAYESISNKIEGRKTECLKEHV